MVVLVFIDPVHRDFLAFNLCPSVLSDSKSSCLKERLPLKSSVVSKKIDSVAEMLDFNAVKYITEAKKKAISQDEIEKIHQKCIQDGKCKLCHKGCYDTPRDTHKMVHEQVLCNRFFGVLKLFRTASEGCRCKSQRGMRKYWEESVENLGHLARRLVYEENRVIFFKYGSSALRRPIPCPRKRIQFFTWASLGRNSI